MDKIKIAERLGGSILQSVVENLRSNPVYVTKASFVSPYITIEDFTEEFNYILKCDTPVTDVGITYNTLTKVRDILAENKSQGGAWSYRNLWGCVTSMGYSLMSTTVPHVDLTDPERDTSKPGYLCIYYNIPGGMSYACSYKIPEENVSFPPWEDDRTCLEEMTPLEDSIILAEVVRSTHDACDSTSSDADDSLSTTILDCTNVLTMLAGPGGDFYGKNKVNMDLVISIVLSNGSKGSSGGVNKFIDDLLAASGPPDGQINCVITYGNDRVVTIPSSQFKDYNLERAVQKDDQDH